MSADGICGRPGKISRRLLGQHVKGRIQVEIVFHARKGRSWTSHIWRTASENFAGKCDDALWVDETNSAILRLAADCRIGKRLEVEPVHRRG